MAAERIRIDVSPDELQARLWVVPGAVMDRDQVLTALARSSVTYGIDAVVLDELVAQLADPTFCADAVPIAAGQPMRRESNDYCELALDVGLRAGQALEDGSFDYRERGLLTPVQRGQLVGRCSAAVVGLDGRTVTGRVIPFEMLRSRAPVSFGTGLVRRDNGEVVALHDGVAQRIEPATIAVIDEYLHKGDVDLRSGHLDMRGGLKVTGDVTAKFAVQASGDIEIGKSVVRGTVYSGGNVRVRGGVLGIGRGTVFAEGDVEAEHGQNAEIYCGGTVHLRKASVGCGLHAQNIRVEGAVLGGLLHAERVIVVGVVGAPRGGEVELAVGVELTRPIRRRFDTQRREYHLVDRIGAQLVGSRGSERRRGGTPVHDPGDPLDRAWPLAAAAHIDVLGMVHPGCIIAIGPHRLLVEQPYQRCRFSLDSETGALRNDPLP